MNVHPSEGPVTGNPLRDFLRIAVLLASLLHDLGKGTVGFQAKLLAAIEGITGGGKDPLRHELVSVLLLNVQSPQDLFEAAEKGCLPRWFDAQAVALGSAESKRNAYEWIQSCRSIQSNDNDSLAAAQVRQFSDELVFNRTEAWQQSPLWMSVLWLVYTHHKLFRGRWQSISGAFTLTPESHLNTDSLECLERDQDSEVTQAQVEDFLTLSPGHQPWHDSSWCLALQRVCEQLKELRLAYPDYEKCLFESLPSGQKGLGASTVWVKSLTRIGRLSLVLGDYEASSDAVKGWTPVPSLTGVFANTKHQGEQIFMGDSLPVHLLKTSHCAEVIFDGLLAPNDAPLFKPGQIAGAEVPHALREFSADEQSPFYWQSKVIQAAKTMQDHDAGAFVVVAAGTGRGKTKACAAFMANSRASVRYSVLLSMRSLTFQTAKAYVNHTIGYHPDQVAMFVGDDILKKRFREERKRQRQRLKSSRLSPGSDNQVALHEREQAVLYSGPTDSLGMTLNSLQDDHFLIRTLSAPVSVMTVDHVIRTLNLRKSSDLLQLLPLLSADLILDEIDDYRGQDLVTMGRLIELAGQFGRRVVIASATLPKTIVDGFYCAYCEGYKVYQAMYGVGDLRAMVMTHMAPYVSEPAVDEPFIDCYERTMTAFCEEERAQSIEQPRRTVRNSKDLLLPLSRRAIPEGIFKDQVQTISKLVSGSYSRYSAAQAQHHFYQTASASAYLLHGMNTLQAEGIRYSAGAIRFNSVVSAQQYLRWVANTNMVEAYAKMGVTLKYICYHAQNLGLIRYLQESFLDQHLKRSAMNEGQADPLLACQDVQDAFEDARIQGHRDVLFIIVTTSIFETGRDYDLDWAVLEPCSTASIVQFAGRVRRHRVATHKAINLLVLPCSQEALVNPAQAWRDLKHTPFTPKDRPSKAEIQALNRMGICVLQSLKTMPSSVEEAFVQELHNGLPLHAGHCLMMPESYAKAPLTSMERVYQLSLIKKAHATREGFPFTLEYALQHADTLLCDTFYRSHPFRGGGDIYTLEYLPEAGWICQNEQGQVRCVQHAIESELGGCIEQPQLFLLKDLNYSGYEQMITMSESIARSLGYQQEDLSVACSTLLSTQRENEHEALIYHAQLGFSRQS